MEQVIEIKFNDTTHQWELALDNAKALCDKFIKERELPELEIKTDLEYKMLYQSRTEINNKIAEIKRARLQAVKTITGEFSRSCKELEKDLALASNRMTERLYSYKPRAKEETYSLTITTTNKGAYDKVKGMLSKYKDINIEEKE